MLRNRHFHSCVAALGILLACAPPAQTQSAGNSVPRRLELPQAETLLIDRNLTVLAAKFQIDVNRAARLISSYKPNPVLTIGAEQIPFYSPIAGSYPRFWDTNSDAGANPVYTVRIDKIWERGDKRELRTALADEQLKASEAQMLDAVRTQLFQLRKSFTAAALARESLKLAETADQQYAQTESLTKVKVAQGDIAQVEVYRVSAGRLQYQTAVLQARSAYDSAIRDVLNLLGAHEKDLGPVIPLSSQPQTVAATQNDTQLPDSLRNVPMELVSAFDDRPIVQTLDELRTLALVQRPDVLAARHLLTSAESGVKLAQAQQTRDVDTAYEYQKVGNDHSAGIVFQVPLFLSNNQKALATQAEAQRLTAEAQWKQAELQAITDVDKAYQSYFAARQVLDLYSTTNLTQVDKLRSVATLSYREGASSLFELLDAQRAYSAAMSAYEQARSDYQMALWGLEQAVGGSLR